MQDDLFNQPYYTNSGAGPPNQSNASFYHHQGGPPNASTSSSAPSNRYDPFENLNTAAQLELVLQQASEQQQQEDEGGVTPENEVGTSSSTHSAGRKKSGRPRDRVWDFFDGDRSLASCKYCCWRSEHPKAFRMKTHALSQCETIPQEKKQELLRYEADKVRAKKQQEIEAERIKAEKAKALEEEKKQEEATRARGGGVNGANGAVPQQSEAGPPAAKKVKREHNPILTAHHGPPPPLPSNQPPVMAPSTSSGQAPQPPAPAPRSPITCHVLDSTTGKPAPDMRIRLDRLNTSGFVLQGQGTTDKDGRCNTLLTPGTVLEVGIFKITFFTSEYFTHRGILSFYPFVEIPFEVKSPDEHYHIPCLLAPHSYTTYRGS